VAFFTGTFAGKGTLMYGKDTDILINRTCQINTWWFKAPSWGQRQSQQKRKSVFEVSFVFVLRVTRF
jgi:hypothetical protein